MKVNERFLFPCILFSASVWVGIAYIAYKLLAGTPE